MIRRPSCEKCSNFKTCEVKLTIPRKEYNIAECLEVKITCSNYDMIGTKLAKDLRRNLDIAECI